MTKVDFYILPADSIEQRHLFACRLADKAYKLGNDIYIHSDDNAQANALDQLLWSWRNSSFLPHQRLSEQPDKQPSEKIQIGYGSQPTTNLNGLLINLSQSVPDCFSRFDRVSEIVVQLPAITEASRANYRFYRDRGYQLENHDLRK
jgi:DNA polymerase-3 subunit chi